MYGFLIAILFMCGVAAFCVLSVSGVFLRLKLFFYIKKTKNKAYFDEFDRILTSPEFKVKKELLKDLEGVTALKKTDLFGAYLSLLKLTGRRDTAEFKSCNIFRGKNISVLIFEDKIILNHKDRRYFGSVALDGARLKAVKHTVNRTEYYFESGEKIFKSVLILDSNALVYSGDGGIRGSLKFVGRKNKQRYNFTGGAYENPFVGFDGYVKDKQNFISLFDRLAESVAEGDEYPFDSIDLCGIVSMPLKNHFELKYKIVEESGGVFDRVSAVRILELLAAFGSNIIYNHTVCGATVKSRQIIVCKNDLPLAVCPRLSCIDTKGEGVTASLLLNSKKLGRAFLSLSRLYESLKAKSAKVTDVFTLMLLAYSSQGGESGELLYSAVKHQLIDGNFIRFSNGKSGIYDKYDRFAVVFPIFLSVFAKEGNRDFLDKKVKYSALSGGKIDGGTAFGDIEKIYPSDMVYEHAVKCFELFDFKDDFIRADLREHAGGYFKGALKNKNLIFTLIYLYSVGSMEGFLTEGDYKKFIGFAKSLSLKVKNVLGSSEFLKADRTEKLIILAFAEAAFKDGQFAASFEFADFYDFFESYAAAKGRVKEIDVLSAVVYILGCVFAGDTDGAFVFAGELLNLMTASGERVLKEKLCYDGERFYFDGNEDINLSILFYGLLKKRILGIGFLDGRLVLGRLADKLDGETLSINSRGRTFNVLLKKSGKNRITVGNTVYTNVKNYPLDSLAEGSDCIVEF